MATPDEVREVLGALAQYTGRPLPDGAVGLFATAFTTTVAQALADAGVAWMRSHSPSSVLPSPQDLRGFVRTMAAEPTAAKRDTTEAWSGLERRARTPYQRAGARMMRHAMATADLAARARIFRAFGADQGEREPWESMAAMCEMDEPTRLQAIADEREGKRRADVMRRGKLAAMGGAA